MTFRADSMAFFAKANYAMPKNISERPSGNPNWIMERELDEMEAILQGKKLIPYWREYHRSWTGGSVIPEKGLGINFKKFFSEPQDFDLILTMQGTNMEPYLEVGSLSTPRAWSRMTGVFRGQFFGFAVWFN